MTGSRYLVEAGGLKLLVDCGIFQERAFLERNWEPSPVPPDEIDYLLLTHALWVTDRDLAAWIAVPAASAELLTGHLSDALSLRQAGRQAVLDGEVEWEEGASFLRDDPADNRV